MSHLKLKGDFLYDDNIRYNLPLLGLPTTGLRVKEENGQLIVNDLPLHPAMGEEMATKTDLAIVLGLSVLVASVIYSAAIYLMF